MRRLKERVWKELPGFHLGYNMPNMGEIDWKLSDENLEALAGGGLWMNEGIGQWRKQNSVSYATIRDYLETELRAAELVHEKGGIYLHIMGIQTLSKTQKVDSYYKFVAAILAGIHPAYGDHVVAGGSENWGYFITRWNSLFWNHQRRTLDCAAEKIELKNAPENLFWRDWARRFPGAAGEEVWSIPLLLLPKKDSIGSSQFPVAENGLRLGMAAATRTRVKSVHWIVPDAEPVALTISPEGEIALPSVHPLGILVLSMQAQEPLPQIVRAPFADVKPTAPQKVVENTYVAYDPNKPAENTDPKTPDKVNRKYAVKYSVSLLYTRISTPDTPSGFAAGADKSCPNALAGVYYWSGLTPGRYRFIARVKATRYNIASPKLSLHVREMSKKTQLAHPGLSASKTVPFSSLSGEGKWDEVVFTEDYVHMGSGPCQVTMSAKIAKGDPADAAVMLDWVGAELLESYDDKKIIALLKLPDAGPAVVGPREKTLFIHGVFDDLYRIPEAVKIAYGEKTALTSVYPRNLLSLGKTVVDQKRGAPPVMSDLLIDGETETAGESEKVKEKSKTLKQKTLSEILAGFGTIIIPNLKCGGMKIETRKVYADWVRAGGTLVLLGGNYAFANGGMQNTLFADLLPCEILGSLSKNKQPLRLELKNGTEPALLYYTHPSTTRAGAKVLLGDNQHPVLCGWTVGKGRCIVFNGAVLGAPRDAKEAFWNSPAWPNTLAAALNASY